MSASGTDVRRRRIAFGLFAGMLLSASLAVAQPVSPPREPFVLHPEVRALLLRLQSGWLEWLTALNLGDAARSEIAVDDLLAHADLIGMQWLPELAVGAAGKSVEFAREGDVEKANLGLRAARRLDPSRPEVWFAAATLRRLEGHYFKSLGNWSRGWIATLGTRLGRAALIGDLALWGLSALSLLALMSAAVLMATRGTLLYRDLRVAFSRHLPVPLAHLLCLLLLIWPLALPAGPFWLALYWSVLLWVYAALPERALLALVWVALAVVPSFIFVLDRKLEVLRFPPMQALESAAAGRLEGDLFTDLGELQAVLPNSVAILHLSADLHGKLGQWDLARSLYREVLEAQPGEATALIDLGVGYFTNGDFQRAIENFRLADGTGVARAEIPFNLSLAHSELYRFSDSESSLRRARQIDSKAVTVWMRQEDGRRVVAAAGGLRRVDEIRRQLAEEWGRGRVGSPWPGVWRTPLVLPLALGFLLIAVVIRLVVGGGSKSSGRDDASWWGGKSDLVRQALLPGVPEADEGRWAGMLAALSVPALLIGLVVAGRLGFRPPWALVPAQPRLWLLAALGLGLVLLIRLRRVWGR